MLKEFLIFVAFFLVINQALYSQCALKEIPLNERVELSKVIIEGKVTSSFSFWGNDQRKIYTSSQVEVFKVFKGNISTDEVEIITEGGIVGNEMMVTSSLLTLKQGEMGIFICTPSNVNIPAGFQKKESITLDVVASRQGFIKYDPENLSATDVFTVYPHVKEVYKNITRLTNKNFRVVKAIDLNVSKNKNKSIAAPVITGFSPETITAGTGSVLTVNGTGFGLMSTGKVSFRDADVGMISYVDALATQIKSWSDTQIKVEVPYNAGTGKIQVTNITTTTSASTLTIPYAHSNVTTAGFSYESRFVEQDVGGYVWQMYESFEANSPAKAAFIRAFTNWRCATFVNWSLGETTVVDKTENDEMNVIRFDIGNELPAGVLGLCYSYYTSCSAGIWYLSEFDIVFNDATNWQYGPALPTSTQFDFESIVLHELGHGHQLGHVINTADLMHFSFSGGSHKRTLNTNNIECGNYVMNKSITGGICGKLPMKPLNPSICADPSLAVYEFEGLMISPNPFAAITHFSYQFSLESSVKIELYNILGQKLAILVNEIQEAGKYEYELNGKDYGLMSGTYILKLTLNGTAHTQKVIHITQK